MANMIFGKKNKQNVVFKKRNVLFIKFGIIAVKFRSKLYAKTRTSLYKWKTFFVAPMVEIKLLSTITKTLKAFHIDAVAELKTSSAATFFKKLLLKTTTALQTQSVVKELKPLSLNNRTCVQAKIEPTKAKFFFVFEAIRAHMRTAVAILKMLVGKFSARISTNISISLIKACVFAENLMFRLHTKALSISKITGFASREVLSFFTKSAADKVTGAGFDEKMSVGTYLSSNRFKNVRFHERLSRCSVARCFVVTRFIANYSARLTDKAKLAILKRVQLLSTLGIGTVLKLTIYTSFRFTNSLRLIMLATMTKLNILCARCRLPLCVQARVIKMVNMVAKNPVVLGGSSSLTVYSPSLVTNFDDRTISSIDALSIFELDYTIRR